MALHRHASIDVTDASREPSALPPGLVTRAVRSVVLSAPQTARIGTPFPGPWHGSEEDVFRFHFLQMTSVLIRPIATPSSPLTTATMAIRLRRAGLSDAGS